MGTGVSIGIVGSAADWTAVTTEQGLRITIKAGSNKALAGLHKIGIVLNAFHSETDTTNVEELSFSMSLSQMSDDETGRGSADRHYYCRLQ